MGDSSGLIVQIVVVLLVLFSFFVLYMCYKTWNIFHVIASFFTFAAAIVFVVFAALVLKTHQEWRQAYNRTLAALQAAQAQEKLLLEGDPNGANPEDKRSVLSLKSELRQVLSDRGRVWPECTPRIDAAGLVVNVVPASTPTPPAEVNHQIKPNMVLYAFREVELIPGRERMPHVYLGEFKVTAAPDKAPEIALTPVSPLDQYQLTQAQQPGTWTLYEIMPVDSHHLFAVDDLVDNVEGKTAMFGKMLPAEQIAAYMPNSLNLPADKYQQLIDSYARDGQKALETDSPESTWMKVRFLKEHKIDVDSDAPATPFSNDNFDLSGAALRAELRHGVEGGSAFAPDDYGFFPRDLEPDPQSGRYADGSAEQLLNDGIVERDQTEPLVYVRPLNNYEHAYHEIARRSLRLDSDMQLVTDDTKVITDAIAHTQKQIDTRQAEFAKLDSDRKEFRDEAAQIAEYHKSLTNTHAALVSALNGLYHANLTLAEELATLQKSMAADIDRRAAAVAIGP